MSATRWTAVTFAVLLSASPMAAQPTLTTIQDTLYKADGARFDGYAFVEWKSFETSTGVQIPEQSLVVKISGGNLRVQLAPTTTAPQGAYYQVKFNSNGRIQFVEYWSVPPSSTVLKLRDVRLAGVPSPGSGGVGAGASVAIADIPGLQDELNARPVKGGSYAPGRTAVINGTGSIDGVGGNLTDCVRVDGTTVPCSTGPLGFIDNETPTGLINGTNAVFTLTNPPNPTASLALYKNGVRQREGGDYTLAGNTVTFVAAAIPHTGDSIVASYRTGEAGPETPVGAAGGHLTGFYPDPQIAERVISDFNIAASAAIAESKLALNFPTHTNVNDPTTAEKAAMSGTAGTPSVTNRFVTAQDPRLIDSRTPTTHGLLSAAHGDASTGTPIRGDLIVAQGAPSLWTRLPLGGANRCLTSNGLDAVWNACLFTGFEIGSVPFVDGSGNLTQSEGFAFDPASKRLSVGNNLSLSTGYFYNSTPLTGVTTMAVRAGEGQGTAPLQRWLDATGAELATISADGAASVRGLETRTTSSMAGLRDLGSTSDPTNRQDGDMWFNTAQQTRKTVEAGQVHTQAQVLCSSTGGLTGGSQRLGACLIPASLLGAGDRIEIHFNYEHTGTASGWNFNIAFGAATLISKNVASTESLGTGRADGALDGTGLVWGVQSYGSSAAYAFQVSTAKAGAPPAGAFLVEFHGTVVTPGTDTVKLLNFTVVRYPAMNNPN